MRRERGGYGNREGEGACQVRKGKMRKKINKKC